METKTIQPKDVVCVRAPVSSIQEELQRIAPLLAEKLAQCSSDSKAPSPDMHYRGTRIVLEFTHERTIENPWGDFAKWNIIQDTMWSREVKTTVRHFE